MPIGMDFPLNGVARDRDPAGKQVDWDAAVGLHADVLWPDRGVPQLHVPFDRVRLAGSV